MIYSGKTTDHHGSPEPHVPGAGKDCIRQVTLLDVQWSNCPVEVEEEVKRLWRANEFGNDHYYYRWTADDVDKQDSVDYPIIAEYLKSRGVTGDCLIRWWW